MLHNALFTGKTQLKKNNRKQNKTKQNKTKQIERKKKRSKENRSKENNETNQALTWPSHADGFLHLGSIGTETIFEADFFLVAYPNSSLQLSFALLPPTFSMYL